MGRKNWQMAKLERPTSGHNTGRRVAVEVPSQSHHHHHHQHQHRQHRSGLSDIDANIEHLQKGRYRPRCFAFVMWTCLGLFIIIIILLIAGISYVSFLKSGKPHVNVQRLNINNMQVDDNSQGMHNAAIGLRVSNKNEKLKLLYGSLTVDVTKEDVQLGRTRVGGFHQKPKNDTDLDVTMSLDHEIKSDMNATEMVFDVYLSGKIGLKVGGLDVTPVPFLSSCRQIKQMDVDNGSRPGCEVKLFAFRPSKN